MPTRSMKEIHALNLQNNDKIWVKFDDIESQRGRRISDIEEGDNVSLPESLDNDDEYQPLNSNYLHNMDKAGSMRSAPTPRLDDKTLPAIDEQKEDSMVSPDARNRGNSVNEFPQDQPQFIQRTSIASDSTYNYDDEDGSHSGEHGPQFIMRSPSTKKM